MQDVAQPMRQRNAALRVHLEMRVKVDVAPVAHEIGPTKFTPL